MRILAVGNSFSEDATHYLHRAAAAQGIELTVVNLYIGGCSLERHWTNVCTGEAVYDYQLNGVSTGRRVSIAEVLAEGGWDAIVTQQASHDSGWQDTYEPFLGHLVSCFRDQAPGARLLLQETWAYETDSSHVAFPRYHNDQQEMYNRLSSAYRKAAQHHHLELIASGDVIQTVRTKPGFRYDKGELSLCRDGYHMSLDYGRYLLALSWLCVLTGVKATENHFEPDDGGKVELELLDVIRQVVAEMVS